MLSVSRSLRASKAWHATYLVCTLLVFSYILFEVLDIDGSNFPLNPHPLDRTAIVAEVANDAARFYSIEKSELSHDVSLLAQAIAYETLWGRLAQAFTFKPLNSVRTRGYRVALPRSSPSDPFPLL